jgi:hypothetical protein
MVVNTRDIGHLSMLAACRHRVIAIARSICGRAISTQKLGDTLGRR